MSINDLAKAVIEGSPESLASDYAMSPAPKEFEDAIRTTACCEKYSAPGSRQSASREGLVPTYRWIAGRVTDHDGSAEPS